MELLSLPLSDTEKLLIEHEPAGYMKYYVSRERFSKERNKWFSYQHFNFRSKEELLFFLKTISRLEKLLLLT